MLARHEALKGSGIENVEPVLCSRLGRAVLQHVASSTCPKLLDDPANIAANLHAYIQGFSPGAREVLDRFDFAVQIERLNRPNLLYLVVAQFARSTCTRTPSPTSRWATSSRS